jgi:hypothetical protein
VKLSPVVAVVLVVLGIGATGAAAATTVGTSFPHGFAVPTDASLGSPVIGFGAAGRVERTPVIFLHGNNDTPFPTACNPYGSVHAMAQYFLDHGYRASELWGLGYQGDSAISLRRRPTGPALRTRRPRTFPTCAPSSTRSSRTPARSASTSSATASA